MMTDKKLCPECSAENEIDAEFCQECHAPLPDEDSSAFIPPQGPDQEDFELLNSMEDDLPGLLHALKQENDVSIEDDGENQESGTAAEEPDDLFAAEDLGEDEDVPDWLHRIRQRASDEEDSVGEITQKISAAKDSLESDKRTTQRENFESWIQKLRSPIGGFVAGELKEEGLGEDDEESQEEVRDKEPDWLEKIRKAEGKTGLRETQDQPDQGDNSLLNWLVTLEDEEKDIAETEGESPEEGDETLGEDTRETKIVESEAAPAVSLDEGPFAGSIPPRLTITDEEQAQADQLTSTIMDESTPRPIRKLVRRSPLGAARFFFAILLIASLSLSLFLVRTSSNQPIAIQPHDAGLINWVEDLTKGASILIIFDYQPAYASEINLIASPILEELAVRDSEISIISSSVSGHLLYRQLFNTIGVLETVSVSDLGYFPIGAYGAFGLGMESSANWQITGLPESSKELPDEGFDGILILSDTFDGSKAWIEQLTILMPETPINLLVSAQAAPMLRPYFDSGQIAGMVSGIKGGVILETELSGQTSSPLRWQTYQIGLMILMGVMVIGAINAGNKKREEGGDA
jgi:hypothetical protein